MNNTGSETRPTDDSVLRPTERNRMTQAEIDEFLSGRRNAYLSTLQPDGTAQLSPVWFHWEDGLLRFSLGEARRHLKNLRRDPRATALIEEDMRLRDGFPAGAIGVMIVGRATVGDDAEELARYETKMADRYLGSEAGDEDFADAVSTERFFLVTLEPTRIVTWDFRK